MLTLSLIFNPAKDKVLMCFHNKIGMYNFVGGRSQGNETGMEASYREMSEETGLTEDDVELKFIREEFVRAMSDYYPNHNLRKTWNIYVTAGILKSDKELVPEKNSLEWIDIEDKEHFTTKSAGLGNCYTYLQEALDILNIKPQIRSLRKIT